MSSATTVTASEGLIRCARSGESVFVTLSGSHQANGIESEASRRHERFVEKVIYHGLKNLSPRNDDEPAWLFSPEETQEIFRRCEHHGGKVLYVSHVSESGEHDEYLQVSWPTSAQKALHKLREKGCDEKFSVTVKIPKEVVEQWKESE